ncbi:MAG: histidine phosphatase family protein [Treponema sp.]|nr:histidine phosphatase family protein [Candidatus Treponema equifaecale]
MGILYFTRHGETFWNVEKRICGATDIDLTEKGHQQAVEAGRKIKAQLESGEIHIDQILYSPLMRGKKTALHISEITGIPAMEEPALIERNFGFYEGTDNSSEQFKKDRGEVAMSFGRDKGGESNLKTAQRIYNLLDRLLAQPEKTFMLVGHNGLGRIINSYFYDMTNEEFAAFRMENCGILRYDF